MKKMILLVLTLLGFTFANTGMLTPAGESGMGAWLNYGLLTVDSDVDDFEGDWGFGFDYMTGIGLEVGLDMADGSKGLGLGYHYKGLEKIRLAGSWSRMMDDDTDKDTDTLTGTLYCDSGLYGSAGGESVNGADWEFGDVTVGKLWTLDFGTVGVSYWCNVGSGDDEGFDKGIVSFDLGYTF